MKKLQSYVTQIFLLFVLIIAGCSSDTNIVDPSSTLNVKNDVNKTTGKYLSKEAPIEEEDGYFYKINPPNGSVQWQNMNFYWAPARANFTASGKYYAFSQYRLTIDGTNQFSTWSIGTTNCNITYPEDGALHNWQLYADYSYSGGTHSVPYDAGNEWQIRIGLQAPILNDSWSNGHPHLTWNAIPGATGYIVCPSYSAPPIIVTTTDYTDTNYTGPGSANTVSYFVYAFNGMWPISCIPGANSNTVSFSVN